MQTTLRAQNTVNLRAKPLWSRTTRWNVVGATPVVGKPTERRLPRRPTEKSWSIGPLNDHLFTSQTTGLPSNFLGFKQL